MKLLQALFLALKFDFRTRPINSNIGCRRRVAALITAAAFLVGNPVIATETQAAGSKASATSNKAQNASKKLDRTGKTRKGKASYYGRKFYGKKMANGEPMHPHSNVAASKTLPLGTKAKVTNLETGSSAEVEIKDRGPYVDGRIIDVSPKVAEEIDLKKDGTAPVTVKPIEVPKKDEAAKSEASPSSSVGAP